MRTNKAEGYNKGASRSGKQKTDGSPHVVEGMNVFTRVESSKHGGHHYGDQQGRNLHETEHGKRMNHLGGA